MTFTGDTWKSVIKGHSQYGVLKTQFLEIVYFMLGEIELAAKKLEFYTV